MRIYRGFGITKGAAFLTVRSPGDNTEHHVFVGPGTPNDVKGETDLVCRIDNLFIEHRDDRTWAYYAALDGLPWALHAIDDETARDHAIQEFLNNAA